MDTFLKLSLYFKMLDELMHIGAAASHALANGGADNTPMDKIAAHLDSYASALDSLQGVPSMVATVAQEVKTTMGNTPPM